MHQPRTLTRILILLALVVGPLARTPMASAVELSAPQASPLLEGPPRLQLNEEQTIDLQFPEPVPVQSLYRALAESFDLQVIFDPKLKNFELPLELRSVTFRQAMEAIELAAGHFSIPADDRTFLVAADTPQNRRNYEPLVIRTFALEHVKPRDMVTILRSILDVKKVAVDSDLNQMVIRDSDRKMKIVENLVATYDRAPSELAIDVTLLRIDAATRRRLGRGQETRGRVSPEVIASLRQEAGVHVIVDTLLNVFDGGRATLSISELLPAAEGDEESRIVKLAIQIVGTVKGRSGEVSLGLSLDGRLLNGDNTSDISREQTSEISLSNRQTYLLTGLMVASPDAGLSSSAKSSQGNQAEASELALVLTPRIIRNSTLPQHQAQAVWAGSESRLVARARANAKNEEEVKARIRARIKELERAPKADEPSKEDGR